MSRRILLCSLLIGCSASAVLCAESPTRSATATPPSTSALSPTPSPAAKSVVDTTDLTDLKEALQLLKGNYIRPEALDEPELSRATFEGVLARLGRGVVLLPTAAGPSPSPIPFFGDVLESHVGYLRLGDLTPANLEALDGNLKTFADKNVDAVVIDLRAGGSANDFAIASEFAKRFCPKGEPLFGLRKTSAKQERSFTSDRDPIFQGLTIVLVDSDTSGAAEAVAGALRFHEKALLIGQPTAGRAVEYSDLKLPSGKILRVAVAEAVLPGGQSLFPEGLKPDVPVEMPAGDKRTVFQQSQEKGMTPFVLENERPHLNEAALISGRNPELDAMEEAQHLGRIPEKVAVHDPVAQRALDLVTSIAVFQRR